MARVAPFRALRFASLDGLDRLLVPDPGGARAPSPSAPAHHVQRLYHAPDPWAALGRWVEEGEVVREDPALYVLETRPAGRLGGGPKVRFLLGAVGAGDDAAPLEADGPRPSAPPLEPVPVLAADDHRVLAGLLDDVARERVPVWDEAVGDALMRLWRVGSAPLLRRIRSVLEAIPLRPLGPVPERGRYLAAVVPLGAPGVQLLPWHRGLKGLSGFHPDRFLALVKDYARIHELDAPLSTPEGLRAATERLGTLSRGQHAVLLVLPGGDGRLLRFRQGLELDHVPAAPKSPTLRSLDLALLNALVLKTVLGIRSPEAPGHPNVHPVPSLEGLVDQVQAGVFDAGFALNPPPSWEVRAVIEAAQSLPARTLRLSPVPPAGLLFLDRGAGA